MPFTSYLYFCSHSNPLDTTSSTLHSSPIVSKRQYTPPKYVAPMLRSRSEITFHVLPHFSSHDISKKKKLRLFRRSPFDCKELTQSSRSKSMSETKIFPVAFWMPNCRLAATTSPGTLNSASNSFQSKEPERELRIAFPS